MYADTGGIFFCFYLQLNSFLLKDNINPIERVYIVLFVFYRIRVPPELISKSDKKRKEFRRSCTKIKKFSKMLPFLISAALY